MTPSEAKGEFQIRYYLWSISEFEKEIEESFPNLRLFKAGSVWKTYQFMLRLDKRDQLTLAHALLKRFHHDAVKALGENCSPEEQLLRSRCDEFFRINGLYQWVKRSEKAGRFLEAKTVFETFRQEATRIYGESRQDDEESLRSRLDSFFRSVPPTFEQELAARKQAGEKIKFVSKRKLQKTMTEMFKTTFADQITNFTFDDTLDPLSGFDIKCCGWILSTHFWFGRRESLINYSHSLASPTTFEHRGNQVPTMVMGHSISWLGMNQWEYITEEEVGPTCNDVVNLCRRFIEVAPKLLKGLEFYKVTP